MVSLNIILRVAAYYRMSSDDQSASIDQQQREVRRYAEQRGWIIVKEYIDEGLSGSKRPERRVAFHQLIADSSKGEFVAVLVWDTSRFGRLDSQAGAKHKMVLRENGVHLETVKGERIDWNTSMGRMMDALKSESDSEYSKNLAANVVRGRLDTMTAGNWPHGAIPFGYDRQLVDGATVKMVVPRIENFRKPHNWKLRLIPNEIEAAIIRRMFTEFAERDISMHQLAVEFAKELGPSGTTGWPYNTIAATLKNPVYAGDVAFAMRAARCMRGAFSQATPQIKRDGCPALISRALFDRVQAKINSRKVTNRRARKTKREYALSGLLVCGHCGHRLSGNCSEHRIYYGCLSPQNRPHLGCKNWKVREDRILPAICRAVASAVDFELLRAIQARPAPAEPTEVAHLKSSVAALKKKINQGSENLLMASPAVFANLQKVLTKWKDELATVENTLALATTQVKQSEVERWEQWWQLVKGKLVEVCPIEWGDRHWQRNPILAGRSLLRAIRAKIGKASGTTEIDGKTYSLDADGVWELVEVEGPVRSAVLAQTETLRELLGRLNLSVVLSWQPNGQRYFKLTRAIVRAEFGEKELSLTDPVREVATCQRMNSSRNSYLPAFPLIRIEKTLVFSANAAPASPVPFVRHWRKNRR